MGNAPDYSFVYAPFTFHSGYIPMTTVSLIVDKKLKLYIPFWLYSNRYITGLKFGEISLHSILVIFQCSYILHPNNLQDLYIPFWLYSNKYMEKNKDYTVRLYIPFWLYSNEESEMTSEQEQASLHSILVIFQL